MPFQMLALDSEWFEDWDLDKPLIENILLKNFRGLKEARKLLWDFCGFAADSRCIILLCCSFAASAIRNLIVARSPFNNASLRCCAAASSHPSSGGTVTEVVIVPRFFGPDDNMLISSPLESGGNSARMLLGMSCKNPPLMPVHTCSKNSTWKRTVIPQ